MAPMQFSAAFHRFAIGQQLDLDIAAGGFGVGNG